MFGYLCEYENEKCYLGIKEVIMICSRLLIVCYIEWENMFAGLDFNTIWNVFHSKFTQFVNK